MPVPGGGPQSHPTPKTGMPVGKMDPGVNQLHPPATLGSWLWDGSHLHPHSRAAWLQTATLLPPNHTPQGDVSSFPWPCVCLCKINVESLPISESPEKFPSIPESIPAGSCEEHHLNQGVSIFAWYCLLSSKSLLLNSLTSTWLPSIKTIFEGFCCLTHWKRP